MSNRPTKLLYGMFLDCANSDQVEQVERLHEIGKKGPANHLMLRVIVKRWIELNNKKPSKKIAQRVAKSPNAGFQRLVI